MALKTAGASVDRSGLAVVSITASAVAKSDFHESVFAGSLIRGMTLAAMSIGSRTGGEMNVLSSSASCLDLESDRVCP
jgi:hypothetical protein